MEMRRRTQGCFVQNRRKQGLAAAAVEWGAACVSNMRPWCVLIASLFAANRNACLNHLLPPSSILHESRTKLNLSPVLDIKTPSPCASVTLVVPPHSPSTRSASPSGANVAAAWSLEQSCATHCNAARRDVPLSPRRKHAHRTQ